MADQEKSKDVQLLKNTTISVLVDEALEDMLVVTYEYGIKIFKGILLDYTKRNLPCGIPNLNPAFNIVAKDKTNPDDNILYSVNQRFAYMDPNHAKPKNVRIPSKYKNNKMTVRLRPRQVLCSKCKGICNENSENVSKKRKSQDGGQVPPPKRAANAPVTRSVYSEQLSKKKMGDPKSQPILIPKLSRLLPQDISNALNGNLENLSQGGDRLKKEAVKTISSNLKSNVSVSEEEIKGSTIEDDPDKDHSDTSTSSQEDDVTAQNPQLISKAMKRTLRKKRSIGSMEDLWDESVFEEQKNNDPTKNNECTAENSQNTCVNTRTIKISYGPQGEGTVLKIPAPIEKFNASEDSEENINTINQDSTKADDGNKAARKALKRARKKARQRRLISGNSPSQIHAMSPRYSIGGASPRYSIVGASPRHCIGSNSPRYVSSSTELHLPKRHKHKLKRKRKHRDIKDRKCKEGEENSGQENVCKDQAVTQKLSINLKRLHNTYTSCQNASDKGEENTSSSDEHSEQAPDFPPSILRANTQTVSSVIGADGSCLLVGDVVWGKLQGFPWWPGKVLTIACSGDQNPQAHVAWYGSSTSSLIQCDQLNAYLENFKIRYNKKKRGAYKEAIREATTEAKSGTNARLRKEAALVGSPSQSIMTVPPSSLASPREIDVMS